jgi:hypothetical protein
LPYKGGNPEQIMSLGPQIGYTRASLAAVAWIAVLRTAQDRYLLEPDESPDSYAEFLARTSGVLLHEPSARFRGRRTGAR